LDGVKWNEEEIKSIFGKYIEYLEDHLLSVTVVPMRNKKVRWRAIINFFIPYALEFQTRLHE
jgi:hypothetical protein